MNNEFCSKSVVHFLRKLRKYGAVLVVYNDLGKDDFTSYLKEIDSVEHDDDFSHEHLEEIFTQAPVFTAEQAKAYLNGYEDKAMFTHGLKDENRKLREEVSKLKLELELKTFWSSPWSSLFKCLRSYLLDKNDHPGTDRNGKLLSSGKS